LLPEANLVLAEHFKRSAALEANHYRMIDATIMGIELILTTSPVAT
jgi:hypothetical protein